VVKSGMGDLKTGGQDGFAPLRPPGWPGSVSTFIGEIWSRFFIVDQRLSPWTGLSDRPVPCLSRSSSVRLSMVKDLFVGVDQPVLVVHIFFSKWGDPGLCINDAHSRGCAYIVLLLLR
jgi:hypothetical protein